jgi:uncharacterized integral membrane protein (TIGR00698 family)
MSLDHPLTVTAPALGDALAGQDMLARWRARAPGLLLAALVGAAAMASGSIGWFQNNGISALTIAIVMGMVIGNTGYRRISQSCTAGVGFSKQNLLRLGVVLYGFRLTFQDVGQVGVEGAAIDAVMLCSTFFLATFLGTRVFGLERSTAMLIGAGSSICGAAAVMATEPVVRGRASEVAIAVSTVVVFGTVAIFVYPLIYHALAGVPSLMLSERDYGLFAGSTIHEVAQVFAAGRSISLDAANTAVITKMVRVMMLAPFLVMLSAWLSRQEKTEHQAAAAPDARAITIPWFAVLFVLVTGFNSLALLPKASVSAIIDVDTFLLAMAMAALGLTTHLSAIRVAGVKPLALGATLFVWLILGGLAVHHIVAAFF